MFPKLPLKYVFLAVFLGLFVIISLLFFSYSQFNFMFFEDVVISLENSKEISVFSNESLHTSFSVRITPNFLCSSVCTYSLVSVSSGDVLFKEEVFVRGTQSINKNHVFAGNFNFEGEEYYNFVVSCSNVESFVCNARTEPRSRTKFVVLNMVFSDDKRDFIDSLLVSLNSYIDRVFYVKEIIESINSFNLRFGQSFFLFVYDPYLSAVSSVRNLWSLGFYEDIIVDFDSFSLFEREVINEGDRVLSFVEEYNFQISYFNDFNYSLLDLYFSLSDFSGDFERLLEFESLLNSSFISLSSNYSLVNLSFINESFNNLSPNIDEYQIYLETAFLLDKKEVYESSLYSFCSDVSYILSRPVSNESVDEVLARASLYNEFNISYFNRKVSLKLAEFNLTLNDAVNISSSNPLIPPEFFDFLSSSRCINYNTTRFSGEFISFNVSSPEVGYLNHNPSLCCAFDSCSVCGENISNPLLLIHGYSFGRANTPEYSTDIFNNMIKYLTRKRVYIDAGIIGPDTVSFSVASPVPLVFRGTYYFVTLFDELGYVTSVSKSENIDTYAIRLNSMINDVLSSTGAQKVDVVAHSMGGLVLRRYMQIFGEESLDNVVLVGVPNNGISPSIRRFCGLFGVNRECDDLAQGSTFLSVLNNPENIPSINITNIVGVGCSMPEGDGDGVVLRSSAELSFASNYFVEGDCRNNPSFHSALLYPGHYEEVFDIVLRRLDID